MIGLFNGGVCRTLYDMASKLIGQIHGRCTMTVFSISQSAACTMLGVQAWLISDRETLQIVLSIPYIVGILAYWYGFIF